MKLNIKERLMMLELLPEKGALLTMTNKRNIIKKVDFSSEEIETFEIKQTEKGIIRPLQWIIFVLCIKSEQLKSCISKKSTFKRRKIFKLNNECILLG